MSGEPVLSHIGIVEARGDTSSSVEYDMLDAYINSSLEALVVSTGSSNAEQMLKRIENGDVPIGDAFAIRKRLEDLVKYREKPSFLLNHFYPRGIPSYRLENIEGRKIERLEGMDKAFGFQVLFNGDIVSESNLCTLFRQT